MCPVYFESIRVIDGQVYHLEYHQRRVNQSSTVQLQDVLRTISLPQEGIYKLKISYTPTTILHTDISRYIPKRIETLKIVEDNRIDYSLKREDRSVLNQLHDMRQECDDVLIVKNGMITDTSFCNILLNNGVNWVTPSTPLLEGTCRARLIQEKKICVEDISLTDLSKFKHFMLINALLDFDLQRQQFISNIRL